MVESIGHPHQHVANAHRGQFGIFSVYRSGEHTLVTSAIELPEGLELVRTTALWSEETVPAAVLSGHRVADGVWGQLVVHSGSVGFVFEDEPDATIQVDAGGSVVIPPGRRHHVVLQGSSTFAVEFYRRAKDQPSEPTSS
jgi:tellurite resistance-related uncharacterized protein